MISSYIQGEGKNLRELMFHRIFVIQGILSNATSVECQAMKCEIT